MRPNPLRRHAAVLGLARFHAEVACSVGHRSERYTKNGACVECNRGSVRDRKVKDRVMALLCGAKTRARKRGLTFALVKDNVVIPDLCPCCGCEFSYNAGRIGGPSRSSPTLDRIDNTKGYVPGNVAVICWHCNRIKGDSTLDELQRITDWVRQVTECPIRRVA